MKKDVYLKNSWTPSKGVEMTLEEMLFNQQGGGRASPPLTKLLWQKKSTNYYINYISQMALI